jgi:nicotinate-nucleotide adenylyltransferase
MKNDLYEVFFNKDPSSLKAKKAVLDKIEELEGAKRFTHSLSVAKLSYEIARSNELKEPERYYLAGLLHDIGKYMHVDEMERLLEDKSPEALKLPKYAWHALVAPFIIDDFFGVHDEEIFEAIKYHCTGHANMKPMDMIIYASDKIDPTRGYDSSKMIDAMMRDYRSGFIDVLGVNKKYLEAESKNSSNIWTDQCYSEYLK